MVADDVLGDATYDERLALRVDTLAAHPLTHLPVEPLHQVEVRVRTRQRLFLNGHEGCPYFSRSSTFTLPTPQRPQHGADKAVDN